MYEKEKSLVLAHACSAANGALAVLCVADTTWAAWPHRNQVALLKMGDQLAESRTVAGRSADDGRTVIQVRWCRMKDWTYLVVACSDGVDFYNQHGSMLLFRFPYSQEGGRCFTRGIAAFVGKVCVGTADGSLLVFQSDTGAEGELHLGQRVRQHSSAISALAADQSHLVSADETGNMIVWSADGGGQIVRLSSIDDYRSPCTGVALSGPSVLAVYGSGHLRVFDRQSGQIRAEATAHARWITGLDVAADSGLVLTVAEDSLVKVWRLDDSGTPLTHKFTEREPDARLVGAGFLRADGATFGIAAYDQKHLFCYAM